MWMRCVRRLLEWDVGAAAEGMVEAFMAQSVKILFGWTLIAALFFAMLMLLWDIPGVRRNIRRIPEWSTVGMRVWRGYNRQRRLHRPTPPAEETRKCWQGRCGRSRLPITPCCVSLDSTDPRVCRRYTSMRNPLQAVSGAAVGGNSAVAACSAK